VVDVDGFVEEDLGALFEFLFALGGEVLARAALRERLLNLRMAHEVVAQAVGHIFALRHDAHARGHMLHDAAHEQGVVGAAEDDGVDVGVEAHELVDALLDEVVGSGRVGLVGFDDGSPQRTGYAGELDVGEQFFDFELVAAALHGAFGGQQSDVSRRGDAADDLGRGSDDAEHASAGIDGRNVALLNGAQGFGRRGVAAEDDEAATHGEQLEHGLAGELIDHLERARAVGRTSIIAQVHVVVLGQQLPDAMQDGQSAVA